MTSLPESIGNLQALQVLDLSYNPNLSSLPSAILNLPNTCIVNINGCNFSPAALDRLREDINQPDYRGPRISLVIMNNDPDQDIDIPTI